MLSALAKPLRFVGIYGIRRTLYKVAARKRGALNWLRPRPRAERDIGVLGCGQFAFATIGCIVAKTEGNRFADCFDPNGDAQATFAHFYRIDSPSADGAALIANPAVKLVFVASNHASHTDYTIDALSRGKSVYCEKPVSVTEEQAGRLFRAVRGSTGRIYAGYNRPHSKAVRMLREVCSSERGPLTLNCFVIGHVLPETHWYRNPEEGTRVCGNVGHWIDLAVHMLRWSSSPDEYRITLACSDPAARDDNMSITISTTRGDLVTIVLTARAEPFEGINETVNFQQGEVTAKIDDFRRMTVWQGRRLAHHRFWPKDVGHERAITQPFRDERRDWSEVEESTLLMLHIAAMVVDGRNESTFRVSETMARLGLGA
jgi:predicted dehydrogenase